MGDQISKITLSTSGDVLPGEVVTLEHAPQQPFSACSFSIPRDLAPHVDVMGISVGGIEQMLADVPMPGVLFQEKEDGRSCNLDVLPVTDERPLQVRLRLHDVGTGPRRLSVTVHGVDMLERYLDRILPPSSMKKRDVEISIFPVDVVAPGATAVSETMVQGIFRADALLIDRSHLFRVLDLRVGIVPMLKPPGVMASVLEELSRAGVALRIDTAQAGQVIRVEVRNEGKEPAPLTGRFVGVEIS